MGSIDESLHKLLRGEVVPLKHVDASYEKKAGEPSYVPVVKRTVCYIVMAVLFDDKDRVLLVQEAKDSCRGDWYLPAGRVERGENLIDGVKREVLEEAGLVFEPISLIGLEVSGGYWYRLLYVGKAVGGKLKTLAEQDKESLQANWFTLKQIENKNVKLRATDILKPIRLAYEYMKTEPGARHPCSSVVIQPHKHLIHRAVIYRQSQNGSVEVLCSKKDGLHIPSCYICPGSQLPMETSICDILLSAFQMEFLGKITCGSLLTVEHCGEPEGEHDGICFTTVVTLSSKVDPKAIENPRNSDYVWCSISDKDVSCEFQKRISQKKLLMPVISL